MNYKLTDMEVLNLINFISVMSFLVIPPLIYHNVLQEVFAKIEPYIFKFEKTFNIKRKKRTRKGTVNLYFPFVKSKPVNNFKMYQYNLPMIWSTILCLCHSSPI